MVVKEVGSNTRLPLWGAMLLSPDVKPAQLRIPLACSDDFALCLVPQASCPCPARCAQLCQNASDATFKLENQTAQVPMRYDVVGKFVGQSLKQSASDDSPDEQAPATTAQESQDDDGDAKSATVTNIKLDDAKFATVDIP